MDESSTIARLASNGHPGYAALSAVGGLGRADRTDPSHYHDPWLDCDTRRDRWWTVGMNTWVRGRVALEWMVGLVVFGRLRAVRVARPAVSAACGQSWANVRAEGLGMLRRQNEHSVAEEEILWTSRRGTRRPSPDQHTPFSEVTALRDFEAI